MECDQQFLESKFVDKTHRQNLVMPHGRGCTTFFSLPFLVIFVMKTELFFGDKRYQVWDEKDKQTKL